MSEAEAFTVIEKAARPGPHQFFDDVVRYGDAHIADPDLQYVSALREAFPNTIITGIPSYNINLIQFAAAGFATCERDVESDSFWGWRGYVGPSQASRNGSLASTTFFAKYHYKWGTEDFILFTVNSMQYLLKERRDDEPLVGPSKLTDTLITAIGTWMFKDVIYVFDGFWRADKALYEEVKKMTWDQVILDKKMKHDLVTVADNFFNSRSDYEDLGVPWKRGLLFHGPPGNGKTISIKALMHTLMDRSPSIPTLYVRNAPAPFYINQVFAQARAMSPCMLVLEDIETIVNQYTRSYFFNEMDGLDNNDGLLVVASTNFLDRLDPGLTKRPSRFDRKYLFPLPNQEERTLYCDFWRKKLQDKPQIEFPWGLCPAMAIITDRFSFAFLQECFVSTLLQLLHEDEDEEDSYTISKPPEDYILYRKFKEQADFLRKQLQNGATSKQLPSPPPPPPLTHSPSHQPRVDENHPDVRFMPAQPQKRFTRLPHLHFVPSRNSQDMVSNRLGQLSLKDELLPESSDEKINFINPASYMLK